MLYNKTILETLLYGLILIIFLQLLYKFIGLNDSKESFVDINKVYNQKDWSIIPPEAWKLPQPKLPICVGKTTKKMSSVSTSGYPIDRMVWKKELSVINNPYEKDSNQYAPGLYVMENNPPYPNFKGGI